MVCWQTASTDENR